MWSILNFGTTNLLFRRDRSRMGLIFPFFLGTLKSLEKNTWHGTSQFPLTILQEISLANFLNNQTSTTGRSSREFWRLGRTQLGHTDFSFGDIPGLNFNLIPLDMMLKAVLSFKAAQACSLSAPSWGSRGPWTVGAWGHSEKPQSYLT